LFSSVNSSTKAKSIPIAIGTAMAVNHCRCAFLWYFLLHKQKKVHAIHIIKSCWCLSPLIS